MTQAGLSSILFPPTPAEIAASVTPTNYTYPPGDIRRYGALSGASPGSGGNGDCTTAFANAVAGVGYALVEAGDWRLDSTVNLNNQSIILKPGAVITRYSANSSATTPMFWFQGSNGSIMGAGASSQILTQNKAPSGIVLNGCASMTSNSPLGQDMLLNTVSNVLLGGALAYGQTSGAPDACYMQISPQLDGHVAYFAILSNVYTQSANFGFWLQGWANANLMSNLFGKWIGNVTRAAPTAQGADALLFSQGAVDNNLTSLFHHYSPATVTLRIEDYDNTGTSGGSDHVTSYSSFRGVVCEQGNDPLGCNPNYPSGGGVACTALALALVANGTCTAFANYIEIVDNVSGGYSLSAAFLTTQTNLLVTSSGGPFYFKATVGVLTARQAIATAAAPAYGTTVAIDASTGNEFDINVTNGTAFTISNPVNGVVGQTITLTIRNSSGGAVGTITWGNLFRMSAWTSPATGNSRSLVLRLYGTTWVEMARTPADVPT